MKRINRIIASVLCLALSLTAVFMAPASAADLDRRLGDIDGDTEVTSIDATLLQRYLLSMIELDDSQLKYTDADLNERIDVIDVTWIQRCAADMETPSYAGMTQKEVEREKIRPSIEEKILYYQQQKGVDISAHNGDVNMNKLKAAGYTFVMIRLGYGEDDTSQDDVWFERNVKKAEAAGLDWGAYIYSYALSVNGVKSEIKHTLRLLKNKRPTMPIAFDIEDDSYKQSHGMPSNTTLQNMCITYLSGIKAAGYYPILYANYYWLTTKLNNNSLLYNYDIWYAQWSSTMEYKGAYVGIWQYGGETNYIDSPYISGLSGKFDKNICYKNYPVFITAYGYNNHEAILESLVASTGAGYLPDDDYEPQLVPQEYADGVMGDSLRVNFEQ